MKKLLAVILAILLASALAVPSLTAKEVSALPLPVEQSDLGAANCTVRAKDTIVVVVVVIVIDDDDDGDATTKKEVVVGTVL